VAHPAQTIVSGVKRDFGQAGNNLPDRLKMGNGKVRNKWYSGAARSSEWIFSIKEKNAGTFKGKMADRWSVAERQALAGFRKSAAPGVRIVPADAQTA